MGEGPVAFGGGIVLSTATGPRSTGSQPMADRCGSVIPAGLSSQRSMRALALEGPVSRPTLRGRIDVLSTDFRPPNRRQTIRFSACAGGGLGGRQCCRPRPRRSTEPSGVPIAPRHQGRVGRDAVHRQPPGADRRTGQHRRRRDDRPARHHRAGHDRARRLRLRREPLPRVVAGSVEFSNPLRFEPFFDVAAETRARSAARRSA